MFGQKPFGSTGFGQSSFGSGSASGSFGAKPTGTSGFGTPGGFGASTPAPGGTGLFGATNTSTTGGSLFGSNANTSGFGNQNAGGSGFSFGQQPNQGSGLFGGNQQQQQQSNIFGTPTTNSVFGAKTPSAGGFGQTTSSAGLFGATSNQNTGLFGSGGTTQQNAGLFGTSGGFGGGMAAQNGTTIKFNPPAGSDTMMKGGTSQSISTRHQCITAMKEYETKSLEELRVEDYTANRKGPQAGSSGLFGGGTQTSTAGGFGGFGQNKPAGSFGGFGTNTSTATSGGGLFGGQNQGSSLFGGQQNKPLFGSTATTSASTGFGGFGSSGGSTSIFGQQNQQKPGGLFGASTSQASGTGGLFGSTSQPSTGFGTSTGFGGFGQQNTQQSGGLFGSKPGGFGATSTGTGLGFGSTLGNTGGFGNKPATTGTAFNFGSGTTGFGGGQSGSLFGNKPTGFGTTTSTLGGTGFGTTGGLGSGLGGGSSLFSGQNKPTLGSGLGTGFGGGTTGFGGLGGAGTSTGLGLGAAAPSTLGNTADTALAQQQAQINQQLMALANSPYGDSPLFKNLKQDDSKREEAMKPTNPAAQKAALAGTPQYKVTPRPTAKIKPKPLQAIVNGKSQLFEGFEEDDSTFGTVTLVPRKSIKRLVLRSSNNSLLEDTTTSPNQSYSQLDSDLVSPVPAHQAVRQSSSESPRSDKPVMNGDADSSILTNHQNHSPLADTPKTGMSNLDDSLAVFRHKLRPMADPSDSVIVEEDEEDVTPHPAGIKLRRPGYFTIPSLEELADMVGEDGHCIVKDFGVGREGYGNVYFPGETDITGLDLDAIVHFRRKEITVYPDDSVKPEEGKGLNKRAQVTLDCVWPMDKTTHQAITDPSRLIEMSYQERIEKATARIGAKFFDYRPESGSWVFEVKHFSKYGLADDSDEEEDFETDPKKLLLLRQQQQQQLAIQKKKIETYKLEEQQKLDGESPLEKLKKGIQIDDEPLDKDLGQNGFAIGKSGLTDYASEKLDKESDILDDDDSDMADITREKFPHDLEGHIGLGGEMMEEDEDEEAVVPSSHRMAAQAGVDAHQVQVMKASFFADEEDMDTEKASLPAGLSGLSSIIPSGLRSHPRTPISHEPNFLHGTSMHKSFQASPTMPASPRVFGENLSSTKIGTRSPPSLFRPAHIVKPIIPAAPEHLILPSGMTMADQPRKIIGARIQRHVPALAQSVMCAHERMVMDAALTRGRACRVGWGPGMTLVHAGNPVLEEEKMKQGGTTRPSILPTTTHAPRRRLDETPYVVQLERVDVSMYSRQANGMLRHLIDQSLATQLKHTEMSAETGCPLYVPRPGTDALHAHADLVQRNADTLGEHGDHPDLDFMHQARLVLDLTVALWGQLPEFINAIHEIDPDSYAYRQARREAFSQWLASAASKRIKRETQSAKYKGSHHLDAVLSHLTGRQISEACCVAQQSGDHRLALLLAQSAGSDIVRQMVIKQLNNWEQEKADRFIPPERLRIYSILAGLMVWPSSHGEVNVCEDLDWKRCLAIHMWYLCNPTASISDALAAYDAAFTGQSHFGRYAAPPLPPYLEDNVMIQAECSPADREGPYAIRDMCYHLLRLHADRSHPMERLLAPTTATANHLDYRLSWLMWQLLQSLDYSHLSECQAATLCTGFSSQLESLGLWHWAVFVLLHIPDHTNREHSVKGVLERHVTLDRDEETQDRESFIVDKLAVPAAWLHKAKARRAKYEQRNHDEAWHLLKAGHWNESHRALLKHVAADAIINEDYSYLKRYLREMSPLEYCTSIQNWSTGGKVFLDYITMIETLDELKRDNISAYELEKLEPEVTSLCNRIGDLQCRTAKDRLCQSEMAKRTANLLRTLMMLKNNSGHPHHSKHVPSKLLAPHLAKLPMPGDYALQELRDLTRSFMLEMTS